MPGKNPCAEKENSFNHPALFKVPSFCPSRRLKTEMMCSIKGILSVKDTPSPQGDSRIINTLAPVVFHEPNWHGPTYFVGFWFSSKELFMDLLFKDE